MTSADAKDEAALWAEFQRLAEPVNAWVDSYNAYFKTYRMFWDEFEAVKRELESFVDRPGIPPGIRVSYSGVLAEVDDAGFNPASRGENPDMDALVQGHQMPGGRPVNGHMSPSREELQVMLYDVEHGNPGAIPTTLEQRIANGREHFLRLRLSDADQAWVGTELARIAAAANSP